MTPAVAATLVREASALFAAAGIDAPERDAEVLLAHVLGIDRGALHARPDRPMEGDAVRRYRELVRRRAAREPIQHLTGQQEFWSLPFRVTPDVLIPRPETEGILEALLERALPVEPGRPRLLDLGTGSGCLAIAAARALPGARVTAVDDSEAALEVARSNAEALGVSDRVAFALGDLYAALPSGTSDGPFDAILSNPPYVAVADLDGLAPEVRDHEPRRALTPGADALAVHRRILQGAPRVLAAGGWLLVEIGAGQEAAVRALYATQEAIRLEEIRPDLAGLPRVVVARAA
ncbi:MAG TPA: peptide chain release factor N(5)-glutamine methyltransferase [Candidatus Polarisedimenticolia bacterium]|nr:peptide chain release factor N(5)-glutamine methyltransferase [Candidatus Polarisedimenticolia bacterium]